MAVGDPQNRIKHSSVTITVLHILATHKLAATDLLGNTDLKDQFYTQDSFAIFFANFFYFQGPFKLCVTLFWHFYDPPS